MLAAVCRCCSARWVLFAHDIGVAVRNSFDGMMVMTRIAARLAKHPARAREAHRRDAAPYIGTSASSHILRCVEQVAPPPRGAHATEQAALARLSKSPMHTLGPELLPVLECVGGHAGRFSLALARCVGPMRAVAIRFVRPSYLPEGLARRRGLGTFPSRGALLCACAVRCAMKRTRILCGSPRLDTFVVHSGARRAVRTACVCGIKGARRWGWVASINACCRLRRCVCAVARAGITGREEEKTQVCV